MVISLSKEIFKQRGLLVHTSKGTRDKKARWTFRRPRSCSAIPVHAPPPPNTRGLLAGAPISGAVGVSGAALTATRAVSWRSLLIDRAFFGELRARAVPFFVCVSFDPAFEHKD